MYTPNDIIQRLIELTKDNKITWCYLDDAKFIYDQLNLEPKAKKTNSFTELQKQLQTARDYFNADNSFYVKINNSFIVLYLIQTESKKNLIIDNLVLAIVPKTFKDIEIFTKTEEMLRLHNLIKSYFPSAVNVIDDLFKL